MTNPLLILLALVAPFPTADRAVERLDCAKTQWKSPPEVVAKTFRGTLTMRCIMVTPGEGDYRQLAETYVRETAKNGTVHEGPIADTYEDLPGVRLDVTAAVNEDGVKSVRSDVYIAGNDQDRFVIATLSKQIVASGLAANILKMDNLARVARATEPRTHVVEVETATRVNKPTFIGVEQFKKIVMDQMESQLKSKGPETAKTIADAM